MRRVRSEISQGPGTWNHFRAKKINPVTLLIEEAQASLLTGDTKANSPPPGHSTDSLASVLAYWVEELRIYS